MRYAWKVAIALLVSLSLYMGFTIGHLNRVIDDKQTYIDVGGCQGWYQGEER